MRRLLIIAVLVLTALPAGAASFDSIVDRVESELGVRKVRLRGVGLLVNSFVFLRRPGGASSMHFAIFEEATPRFQAAVRQAAGKVWTPMVTVHSKRDAGDVVIYLRISGSRFELLIATSEGREATLVHLKLDGNRMLDWLRDPVKISVAGIAKGLRPQYT